MKKKHIALHRIHCWLILCFLWVARGNGRCRGEDDPHRESV